MSFLKPLSFLTFSTSTCNQLCTFLKILLYSRSMTPTFFARLCLSITYIYSTNNQHHKTFFLFTQDIQLHNTSSILHIHSIFHLFNWKPYRSIYLCLLFEQLFHDIISNTFTIAQVQPHFSTTFSQDNNSLKIARRVITAWKEDKCQFRFDF